MKLKLICSWLFTLVLVGVSNSAVAGYFKVSYSGGRVQKVSRNGPFPNQPYTTTIANGVPRRGGGAVGEPYPLPGGPLIATVNCSGGIKTTFTWIPEFPGEPPPKSAVLWEHSIASYSGDSGSCSNGLGDPFIPSDPSNPARGGTSQGFRQTVVTVGPSGGITITRTPSANATKTLPHTWGAKACGADVSYGATLAPVVLAELGAIQAGAIWKSLVGQQLLVSALCVGTNPADGGSHSFPLSNFNWTLPIQQPIAYVETGFGFDPFGRRTNHSLNVDAFSENNISFFSFESCDPSPIVANFSIQLTNSTESGGASSMIEILKPESNMEGYTGAFAGYHDYGIYSDFETNFQYPLSPTTAVGVYFETYQIDATSYPSPNGSHFLVQIFSEGSKFTYSILYEGVVYHFPNANYPDPNPPIGLDNFYPYPAVYPWLTEQFAGDFYKYTTDSPSVRRPTPTLVRIGAELGFKMYDVFRPVSCDGMNVADVPIRRTTWSWIAAAQRANDALENPMIFQGNDTNVLGSFEANPFELVWANRFSNN